MKEIPQEVLNFAEENELMNVSLNDFWCNPKLLFNDYLVFDITFKKNKDFDWFVLAKNNEIRFATQEEYENLKEVYVS
jgi:hypothetical protein